VEEYRRVVLRRVDDALVVGTAVGSVAHLLSELIENGLTFSPPDSEVEVQGRRLVDGYLIAITDQGVGMSTEDLRQANSRLRGEQDFIAAPTRFLGHFVVGRLARETATQVELLPSPVTGVTARVTLPQSLLASSLAVESGDRSDRDAPRAQVPVQLTSVPMPSPSDSGPIAVPTTGPQPVLPAAPAAIALVPPPSPGPTTDRVPPRTPAAPPAAALPAASSSAGPPSSTAPLPNIGPPPNTGPLPSIGPPPNAGRPVVAGPPSDEQPTGGPRLPETVTSMLGSHPLVHPFAGDLTVTAPNDGYRPPQPGSAQPGTPPTGAIHAAGGPGHPTGNRPAGSSAEVAAGQPAARGPVGGPGRGQPTVPGYGTPSAAPSVGYPLTGPLGPGTATPPPPGLPPQGAGGTLLIGGDDEAARTRNGLRKRLPREQRAGGVSAQPARRVIDLTAAERPAVDDSPAEVRARLTAFRAGIQRGQVTGTTRPARAGSDHAVEDPE